MNMVINSLSVPSAADLSSSLQEVKRKEERIRRKEERGRRKEITP
jgi:hypothetical protein